MTSSEWNTLREGLRKYADIDGTEFGEYLQCLLKITNGFLDHHFIYKELTNVVKKTLKIIMNDASEYEDEEDDKIKLFKKWRIQYQYLLDKL